MQGAGALAGYHYIWHSLHLKHHINVLQSLVASILKEIDHEGKLRRRKEERHDLRGVPMFLRDQSSART